MGALFLLAFADTLYPLLGFSFEGKYEYVVFSFMMTTAILHLFGWLEARYTFILARLSVYNRIIVSAIFLTLYLAQRLGIEALMVALYDLSFASLFIFYITFKGKSRE